MEETPQLDLGLIFSAEEEQDMEEYLRRALVIEDEMDRLRQQLADLRTYYKDRILLRPLDTAKKVVRSKRKLERHPKEPCPRQYQIQYEHVVEGVFDRLEREQEAVGQEAERLANTRVYVPDMTQPHA